MRFSRRPLRLEALEDRTVPSLTTTILYNGSLYLSGAPKGELLITHMGANASTFHVSDNGSNVGTFNILQDLDINLTYRVSDIKIDLKGGRIPGNLLINLGNGLIGAGTPGVSVYDDSGAVPTGRISGSVTILGGNGHESIDIGSIAGVATPPFDPVTINGNLTVAASISGSPAGNSLLVDAGTRVGGSVTSTLYSNVAIGSTTTGSALTSIGQNLTISDFGSLHRLSAVDTAAVGGNLNVSGTVLDDNFALQSTTTTAMFNGSGFVGGSANVNLFAGMNGELITLGDNTQVNGNAVLTAGGNLSTGADQFNIGGSVFGNLNVNMGSGLNSLRFTEQVTGDSMPLVQGSMTVFGGNGTNSLFFGALTAGDFQPMIIHTLSITLGGGDNGTLATPNIIAADIGGLITWRSGNAPNFVQLGNSTFDGYSENYTVNMLFGSDDDYLAVDIGAGNLSGVADGGGSITMNTFNLISGTLVGFSHPNFP